MTVRKKAQLSVVASNDKHRTNPKAETLHRIPNYPTKLVIYQLAASPYWWVRYYHNKRILRKSTKETDKRKAIEFAKRFFEEIVTGNLASLSTQQRNVSRFNDCADAMLEAQRQRMERGEITRITQDNDEWRLKKHILPHFGSCLVAEVDYFAVEKFLATLTKEKLSSATLTAYIGLVRKVLSYAQLRGVITALPRLPKVKREDEPRGWFKLDEYHRLVQRARDMAGEEYEVRRVEVKEGDETRAHLVTVKANAKNKQGVQVRRFSISKDLRNVIVFMVHSFVRPTDLKHLQHKHVAIIEDAEQRIKYLRLDLPKSKAHDGAIVTMKTAVNVYRRQVEEQYGLDKNRKLNKPPPNDYVFLPKQLNRDKALKELQQQISVVLSAAKLKQGAKGEERSLYSLRHTSIMFRLLYGEGIDLLTLARNARTSPEMIDRFYARHLSAEMNIDILQSKRLKKVMKKS